MERSSSMPATAANYAAFAAAQEPSFSSLSFEERRKRLEEHCLRSKEQQEQGSDRHPA